MLLVFYYLSFYCFTVQITVPDDGTDRCPLPAGSLSASKLTILLLLGQDSDLFTFRKVQQEQHRLFSDDVGKVHVVNLRQGRR